MMASVPATTTTPDMSWTADWDTVTLTASTSLVSLLMMSPCGRVSKKDSGRRCILSKKPSRTLRTMRWEIPAIIQPSTVCRSAPPRYAARSANAARESAAAGRLKAPSAEAIGDACPRAIAQMASIPLPIRYGTAIPSAESTRMKPATMRIRPRSPAKYDQIRAMVCHRSWGRTFGAPRASAPGPPTAGTGAAGGHSRHGVRAAGQTPTASRPSWAMQMSR